jgi:SAM-dependent methyltransferase
VLRTLYRQTNFPIFQNRVYDTPEEVRNCPVGDIEIVEDLETGLIYNSRFQLELMTYDSKYNNEQALSPYFRRHLEGVAKIIESYLGKTDLVEVGCGKGSFLEMLVKDDFDITGFDPTYEGTNERITRKYFERITRKYFQSPNRGSHIEVGCGKGSFLEMLVKDDFDITGFDPTYEGTNERITRKYFEPGAIKSANHLILRHVLEHVQDPVDFLQQLKHADRGEGLIYIEVPCFDWICQRRAWFDIFYEHVNYFRLSDFQRMFDNIVDSGHLFNGQYIYVVAHLASLKREVVRGKSEPALPSDFNEILTSENSDHPCVIWGGASKGVIFSLLKSRHGQKFSFVIDINPAKQGKYLPITALEVYSPKQDMRSLEESSKIYVMNSNYLGEIREMTKNRFTLIGLDHE